MTKSELIEKIAINQDQLPPRDVEQAVRMILERMTKALVSKQRIEIRGFGSFSLHYRAPRTGRNPKTGDSVSLPGLDGVFQVLNGHASIISSLKKGEINMSLSDKFDAEKFTSDQISSSSESEISVSINGGVVELQNDKMIILAE